MRILLIHNRYQQRGGEDIVFESERKLLRERGHDVFCYERHNDEIKRVQKWRRSGLAIDAIWSQNSFEEIRKIGERFRPDVAHFYNKFPLISPSGYYACSELDIPVVQTIPNFRLICPGAQLLRSNRICLECVGSKFPWRAVLHRCYRGSIVASGVVTTMLTSHWLLGTWAKMVSVYIALTDFARSTLISGGLPENRIVVKPNFLDPDPGGHINDENFVLFVGRLSAEKGIHTLLSSWESLPRIPLKIAGDGPLAPLVAAAVTRGDKQIEHLKWLPREDILSLMKRASFIVVPSQWYEGFPLVIVEAFACGTPVIGSDLGGVGEIVRHNKSGLLFKPGDTDEFSSAVTKLWNDRILRKELGKGARSQFLENYTAEENYKKMMTIFEKVICHEYSPNTARI